MTDINTVNVITCSSGRILRILLVSHEMSFTGAPYSLLQLAVCLKEAGFDVSVWTLKGGELEEKFNAASFKVKKISFSDAEAERAAYGEKIKAFDLVIANTLFCLSFAVFARKYTRTVLYLREAHNIPQLIESCGLNENELYEIEHIICVSDYAANFVKERYGIKNVCVINNFVTDKNEIAMKYVSADGVTGGKKKRFIVSGTIEPRKGQLTAVSAFLALPDELKVQAELHLIGPVPEWSADYFNRLEITEKNGIFYDGVIKSRDKLFEYYLYADVFLIPSRDESCSLVALEAAMLSKAIITSENVGARYLVDKTDIVPTGDEKALSERMAQFIKNPQMAEECGRKNRERYIKYGTKEAFIKKFSSYLNILAGECESPAVINEPGTDDIKVSVVVPVYMSEKYLNECLDSLVSQSLEEIEIICINDGSTDSSAQILEEYKKKESRIRIFTTENLGYGHAMNLGIKNARGKYIGIVESDDFIDPDMYKILYERAEKADADFVKGDFYRFYGPADDRELIYHLTARDIKNYNRVINPQKEKEAFRFFMNTWNGIYKRSFLEEHDISHNETPGASYQDNGFWFKTLCYAKRISFINKPVYYNRRDNLSSSVKNKGKVYSANKEYELIREFLKQNPELEKEFLFQYSMKKYHTYLFTLKRIAPEFRREYLDVFAGEFRKMNEDGELSKAVFVPSEWTNLNWIMRSPEDYYKNSVMAETEISVIIAAYNSEKYIDECLKSIRKQSFTRFECICVNDGSTDGTEEIIRKYTSRDDRFYLINQENRGAGAARNAGLAAAKGKYIIFLDSDDVFSPELLKKSREKIRQSDAEICIIGNYRTDEAMGKISPEIYSVRPECYPPYRPFSAGDVNINPFRCFMGWVWDKLYLRRFIIDNELKFQEQRTTNDMYFAYMSLFKATRITAANEGLIYQRRNVPGSLSATRGKSWWCFYYALCEIKREMCEMGIYKKNEVYFINYALHSCLWNLMTLPEAASGALLEKLDQEWFETLGINRLNSEQCENEDEYKQYMLLKKYGTEGLDKCRRLYDKSTEREKTAATKSGRHRFAPPADAENEADYYRFCLDEIRKSKSYKAGLALTWLPRKIREVTIWKEKNI